MELKVDVGRVVVVVLLMNPAPCVAKPLNTKQDPDATAGRRDRRHISLAAQGRRGRAQQLPGHLMGA